MIFERDENFGVAVDTKNVPIIVDGHGFDSRTGFYYKLFLVFMVYLYAWVALESRLFWFLL